MSSIIYIRKQEQNFDAVVKKVHFIFFRFPIYSENG